jgi:hypothetical protein
MDTGATDENLTLELELEHEVSLPQRHLSNPISFPTLSLA